MEISVELMATLLCYSLVEAMKAEVKIGDSASTVASHPKIPVQVVAGTVTCSFFVGEECSDVAT
jgi:hypothetical protein